MGGTGLAMCIDNGNCCKKTAKIYLTQAGSPLCGSCQFPFPPNNPSYSPGYNVYMTIKIYDNNLNDGTYKDFSSHTIPNSSILYGTNSIPYVEVEVPEVVDFIVMAQIKEPNSTLCCTSCVPCNPPPPGGSCIYPHWTADTEFDNDIYSNTEFQLPFPMEPQRCTPE